ncbi:MAG TPA: hypothetical protein PKM63_22315 [Panacibacter sp.]|nr:hypothetical protein [Panacibacter sp.]HNP47048.1 hypothetical protein [Panacibacter sp.]
MKKSQILKGICIAVLILLITAGGNAQKTKPWMWVKREEGMKREAAFDKKYDRIVNNAHITPEKMIWYPGFFDMLDFFEKSYNKNYAFLRVYIALYPKETDDANVPAGWGKKLTLIFAPADINKRDLGVYFNMVPGEGFVAGKNQITKDQKKFWTTLYTQTVMPSLLSTIDQFDLDNYTQDGVFSDTRSLRFSRTNLKEIANERTRHVHRRNGNPDDISGVKAFFAAYTDEGNQERFGKYPNRLHIEFEFTNKTGDIIYLDDDMKDQFPTGKHPFPDDDEDEKKARILSVNNGQLCPANCPK